MMVSAMDTQAASLLPRFREEVDTQLLRLSQGIVALERDPANGPLLKEVFRAAHTIKGTAKMMGFADIARVTHELESVLSALRDEALTLTPDIIDRLFEAIDVVTDLTLTEAPPGLPPGAVAERREAGGTTTARIDAVIEQLRSLVAVAGPDPAAPVPVAPPAATAPIPSPYGSAAALPTPPPDSAPAGSTGGGPVAPAFLEDTVRVQVQKLDTLMTLAGEMVIGKMQTEAIADQLRQVLDSFRVRQHTLAGLSDAVARNWRGLTQPEMEQGLLRLRAADDDLEQATTIVLRDFENHTARFSSIAEELEDTALSVRMMPVERLFSTFPRAVRDIARESGKQVELQTRGGETELDKKILEGLYEPLVHLLRNAVDHGIETPEEREQVGKARVGRITVRAYQQGSQVAIEVEDDGAGIDRARLREVAVAQGLLSASAATTTADGDVLEWIYRPGFSTARIITDASGRGLGMDIVKTTLERMNGTVQVASAPGRGTTISLRVPLTLATTPGLLIRVATQLFVLPAHTIESMEYVGADDVQRIDQRELVRLRGQTMPLVRLAQLLDLERVGTLHYGGRGAPGGSGAGRGGLTLPGRLPGVVVGDSGHPLCLLVDELLDERVMVVRSLGPVFAGVTTQIGATMLGNGQIVVILDVPSLIAAARTRGAQDQALRAWPVVAVRRPRRILVVDDSITTRELEKSILENAGYEVETSIDGREALQRLEHTDRSFDLVIADVEMPLMDGLELTRAIKQHPEEHIRRLPVIIVSSLSSDTYKRRGVEVGAQAYITKGQFEQNRLLETIDLLIH